MTGERPCVVVGYDGTEAATRALRWALENSAPDCAVIAVAVSGTEPAPYVPGAERIARVGSRVTHSERTMWSGWDYDLEAVGDEVELVVERGLPSQVLLRTIRARGAEMIVLGRHARRFGAVLPSVLRDVLAHSDVPVVVVP